MKAIQSNQNNLVYLDEAQPLISPSQCLVKVAYAGVNRADLLQRKGLYPPPKGESDVLGLEFSGEVVQKGAQVSNISIGDRVCSIVASGAYAEYVKVESSHLIKVPKNLSLEEAGAIPEAFITAFQSLHYIAGLQKDESVLIHAGASGVGAAAIQMAKAAGAKVIVTASQPKHEFCKSLGADECIDYKKVQFDEVAPKVNVVLDLIGGSYFQGNMNVLAVEGRMVMLGFLGGVKADEPNVAGIVIKRLRIEGSTLRARDIAYKAALIQGFAKKYMSEDGFPFKTNVDAVFDFQNTDEAHQYMEQNKNKGKILIKM